MALEALFPRRIKQVVVYYDLLRNTNKTIRWRRFFSSSDPNNKNNSASPAKKGNIPRLRFLPRKRNTTPLLVAIVAIPLVAVGIRAYREPSFYQQLVSYIPGYHRGHPSNQQLAQEESSSSQTKPSNTTSDATNSKAQDNYYSAASAMNETTFNEESTAENSKQTAVPDEKENMQSSSSSSPEQQQQQQPEQNKISNIIQSSLHTFTSAIKEELQPSSLLLLLPAHSDNSNQNDWQENNLLLSTTHVESPLQEVLHQLQDENLSADQLRQQIQYVVAQLEEQNRWEAFRIQEAVRAQSLQDQKEWEQRKEEIRQYYNEKLVEKFNAIQKEMETKFQEQLKSGYETIESQVREEMEKKLGEQSKQLIEEYEQQKREWKEEMDKKLKEILEQERKNRLRMLENLQVQVRALRTQFMENSNFQYASSCVHRISCIAYGLEGLLEGNNKPFDKELEKIKRIISEMAMNEPKRSDQVSDVEMLRYLIATIPREAAEKGIPSEAELIDRFRGILKYLRHAALIPDEKVSSIWSHLVAYVISWLKIPEKGLATGDDAESRIARAEYFITKHNNLYQAVRELEGLNGLCAELASDWIALARWRVVVQQAVQVSRAFVVLEEEALA